MLDEPYILALCVLVGLLTAAAAHPWFSSRTVRKVFHILSVVWGLALVAVAILSLDTYIALIREDNLVEWASAVALLAAWVTGLVSIVSLARRGVSFPMPAFMTAGFFLAFWRELEWGEPFFGRKVWFSRNLFRPRAYIDPRYFEEFAGKLGLQVGPKYTTHLVMAGMMLLFVVVVVAYLLRHRRTFFAEARTILRTSHGRFLLMLLIIYPASQVGGKVFEYIGHVKNLIDEPLELWGATCALMSSIMLWREIRVVDAETLAASEASC